MPELWDSLRVRLRGSAGQTSHLHHRTAWRYRVELPRPTRTRTTVWDAISDLAYLNSGEGEEVQDYRLDAQSEYQTKLRRGLDRLYNHVATAHSKVTLERLRLIPAECGRETLPEEHLTRSIYSGAWCRLRKDGVSRTITTAVRHSPPRECFTHPYLKQSNHDPRGGSYPVLPRYVQVLRSQVVPDEAGR